jgi:hypothetical protein
MTEQHDELELQLCESAWCVVAFEAEEGFAGRCPACLAIADEHHAYGHPDAVSDCLVCDRIPSLGAARTRVRAHAA